VVPDGPTAPLTTRHEQILPHRSPFLRRSGDGLLDKRIVGIKNVSLNERASPLRRRRARCCR
jgi:hypothetical protein